MTLKRNVPSENLQRDFRYRAEIDGLRALAVLPVVLFHAKLGFSGGYIGVDVFFVISGFLISSLIWKDLEEGSFTFAGFWERRIRRLVPAIAVVVLTVMAVGWFVLLPMDLDSLGEASASQAALIANVHYWSDSGYFAAAADEKPLLHTWSLAVEEQFYLFMPFVLWFLHRTTRLRNRRSILAALGTICCASFAISCLQVNRHPDAAFYLLPSRAWELMLGAMVAFAPRPYHGSRNHGRQNHSLQQSTPWLRELYSLIGLALMVVPIFWYDTTTRFPGIAAAFPCLGTAMFIWANTRASSTEKASLLARLLSLRPLVFLGAISYSLYLWHWPLFAFANYLSIWPVGYQTRLILVIVSFGLAVLTWRYVETPFRAKRCCESRRAIYIFGALTGGVVFGAGILLLRNEGFPMRFSKSVREMAAASSDMSFVTDMAAQQIASGKLVRLGKTESKETPGLLVWGDSHAMAALPAVDRWLNELGRLGVAGVRSTTPPVVSLRSDANFLDEDGRAFNQAMLEHIRQTRPPRVLLIARWHWYADFSTSSVPDISDALVATVKQLNQMGVQCSLLLDIPNHSVDVPRALARSTVLGSDISKLLTRPSEDDRHDGLGIATLGKLRELGCILVDPKPAFFDADSQQYRVVDDQTVLYRDGHHLSTKGALHVLPAILKNSGVINLD